MDKEGKKVRQLTTSKEDERQPSWHPGGKKIIFESERDGHTALYTLKIASKKIRKINSTLPSGDLTFASYSPNGRVLAVSFKESEDKSNIVLLKNNGKVINWVTNTEMRSYYPRWSPDGKEIVYFSRKETGNADDEIYRADLETESESRLTDWPQHDFCPSWSPDRKNIVYVTSMEKTRPEIFIMQADGSQKTRITDNEEGETIPFWHPKDKNRILITAFRNGNYEICELTLN